MAGESRDPDLTDLRSARFAANAVVLAVVAVGLAVTLILESPVWVRVFVGLMLLGTSYATLSAWKAWRVAIETERRGAG